MRPYFKSLKTTISLFNNVEAVTLSDKSLLFFVKFNYITLRIVLTLILGRKKRDQLIIERGLDFDAIWSKHLELYKKIYRRSALLRFKLRKYDFEFYCRPNGDDLKTMVFHESYIIENHFAPREGDIVVDIGAHIGLCTMIASKRIDSQGKVIAIEADPENFEILSRNIALNKLENVIALNYAAYSEAKKMKLYLPGHEKALPSTKYNTLIQGRAHGIEKFVEVSADTLDSLLQAASINHKNVNWLKIDVEGAEFEVLKGAARTLCETTNLTALIEVHNVMEQRTRYDEIVQLLGKYGMRVLFEKSYPSGEKHMIARKEIQKTPVI